MAEDQQGTSRLTRPGVLATAAGLLPQPSQNHAMALRALGAVGKRHTTTLAWRRLRNSRRAPWLSRNRAKYRDRVHQVTRFLLQAAGRRRAFLYQRRVLLRHLVHLADR